MSDGFKMPSWSARNPLGIIALFISLIYGMSALLFGMSIDSLEGFNESALVLFIVIFPVVVLTMFGWLVTKHHRKLYGPSDYQSDQGFLDANSPAELGVRLKREVEDVSTSEEITGGQPDLNAHNTPTSKKGTETKTASSVIPSLLEGRQNRMAKAYIAEGLVFQDLQNELGGAVRREMSLRSRSGGRLQVDGIIQSGGITTAVEVKLVANAGYALDRLRQAPYQMQTTVNALKEDGITNIKFIFAVVIDGDLIEDRQIPRMVERFRLDLGDSIEVRTYFYKELLKKYGFPVEPDIILGAPVKL